MISYISFIAFRYFKSKRKGIASTILSVIGIAMGVMTMTAVLAVMNGLQLGFIENILQISSYHIQIFGVTGAPDERLMQDIKELPAVLSVVPFTEQQALIQGNFTGYRGCIIRGLPPDVGLKDPGFMNRLELFDGDFDFHQPDSIVLGMELARHLGCCSGDTITLLDLSSSTSPGAVQKEYLVTGLFKSGYYEIDLGWAFVPLNLDEEIKYGIKIKDRFRDQSAVRQIESVTNEDYRIGTWREFNRAFFGALRMEKVLMIVLIGLIFVVVSFNIYHLLRRAVRERYEEIGVLKALGASSDSIRHIFILEGLLIGFIGGVAGMILGLCVSANINQVFSIAEDTANFILTVLERIIHPIISPGREQFSLFSPAYFYLTEVPSKVLLHEAVLICLFPLFSSIFAAFLASRRVSEVKPAEVLRYE